MKRLRSLLKGYGIFFVLTVSLFPLQAQAVEYPAIHGDNTYEWITGVGFQTISSITARNPRGYGNYTVDRTGWHARVQPGHAYPLSVSIHPDIKWCDEYVYAFFDWNRDGDFVDSGEKYKVAAKTCSAGPHKINVYVPPTARPGETRMRIVLRYFEVPPSAGDIPDGEAEDYTVFVNYPTLLADNRSEWITNVTFAGVSNTTAQNYLGFGDYSFWATGTLANIIHDETYPLRITIHPDSVYCHENIHAFIDWNQDGDFSDQEERTIVAANTCSAGPHVAYIHVPTSARLGRTPMRVVLRYLWAPTPSGYVSGEGEDYTLFVGKRSPFLLFIPPTTGHKR